MIQTNLLFLGDNPALKSGLGRITRDLASLSAATPQFRVRSLGRGGLSSGQLPFHQYVFGEREGFGSDALLEHVVADFVGDKPLAIFCIWDPSRLHWLSQGEFMRKNRHRCKLWIYCPVDSASGPNNTLTRLEREALIGFDRILAYGEYGADILSRTIGAPVDWLPHGINTDIFTPRDKLAARMALGFQPKDKVLSCVMTNQARKDWGVAMRTLALLPDWKMWAHVDVDERHWNIPELIESFGLQDRVRLTYTGSVDDTQLSYYYSAADVSILPSHEGYGYPIAESLACGIPVIHSDGGGNWGLPTVALVPPTMYRIAGSFNRITPIWDPRHWASAVINWERPSAEECSGSVEHLDWKRLWPARWSKWLKAGINVD